MRTSLDHLPANKRRDLQRYVQIMREEFDEKLAISTSERKRRGRILKIILFGSYATGKYVEDRTSGYFSDYDLLVIVNDEEYTDMGDYWHGAQDRMELHAWRDGTNYFNPDPNIIVHSLEDINQQLRDGRYFFRDIAEEGIMLYELSETKGGNAKYKLARPGQPDAAAAKAMAKDYFELWSEKARDGLKTARFNINEEMNNLAAFMLHQATEATYNCLLLTLTQYTPSTHNLKYLRSQAEALDERLRNIWPNKSPGRRRFELLKKAYIEARYSKHYAITKEELEWLHERVTALLAQVEVVCGESLA